MSLHRLAVGVAALVTAGLAASVADAAAATTVQSGWWNEVALGPLAAPTTTPADQLQVSNGLDGPLAFAAVRITPPTGTPTSDKLTLDLTIPAGSSVGTADVAACITTSSWKAGADQSPSAAPGYSCGHGFEAVGKVTGSSATWTVPLAWASDDPVSLALVPAPGTTTPFSVTFDQPDAAAVSFSATPVTAPTATTLPTAPGTAAPFSGLAPAGTSGVSPVLPSGSVTNAGLGAAAVVGPSVSPLPATSSTQAATAPTATRRL